MNSLKKLSVNYIHELFQGVDYIRQETNKYGNPNDDVIKQINK